MYIPNDGSEPLSKIKPPKENLLALDEEYILQYIAGMLDHRHFIKLNKVKTIRRTGKIANKYYISVNFNMLLPYQKSILSHYLSPAFNTSKKMVRFASSNAYYLIKLLYPYLIGNKQLADYAIQLHDNIQILTGFPEDNTKYHAAQDALYTRYSQDKCRDSFNLIPSTSYLIGWIENKAQGKTYTDIKTGKISKYLLLSHISQNLTIDGVNHNGVGLAYRSNSQTIRQILSTNKRYYPLFLKNNIEKLLNLISYNVIDKNEHKQRICAANIELNDARQQIFDLQYCHTCELYLPPHNFYQNSSKTCCSSCLKTINAPYYHNVTKPARKMGTSKREIRNHPHDRAYANVLRRAHLQFKSRKLPKPIGWRKMLGCTKYQLAKYLESKFQKGMSWDNYGTEWHIDHILPISNCNFADGLELEVYLKYKNLQPLWAADNLDKGNRIL